eukprot:scaffold1936_cov154-Amphora_coffeaeformis.AAC.2
MIGSSFLSIVVFVVLPLFVTCLVGVRSCVVGVGFRVAREDYMDDVHHALPRLRMLTSSSRGAQAVNNTAHENTRPPPLDTHASHHWFVDGT